MRLTANKFCISDNVLAYDGLNYWPSQERLDLQL